MLDTEIFNLTSKINYLLNYEDTNLNTNFLNQNNVMDSSIINKNFEIIEDELNNNYERIRVLEEIINYAKIYMQNEIEEIIIECRNILKDIENINDIYFDIYNNYTLINIPLINNDEAQYIDRNGAILQKCNLYNNVLSLPSNINIITPIKNIEVIRSDQPVYSIEPKLTINEKYRIEYLLDGLNKSEIIENVIINFKEPTVINTLRIKTSNCNFEHIIFVYEDNSEFIYKNINLEIFPDIKIKKIIIPIKCNNYLINKYELITEVKNCFEDNTKLL